MDIGVFSKYILGFLFILLRASVFIGMLPFFGSKNLPFQFKVGFIIAMAMVLTPVIEVKVSRGDIPVLLIREVVVGMALGFIARFVFFAVEIAAQLISAAMGLSVAGLFNPEFGQSTDIGMLYGTIAMLVFLSMDAHHDLIYVFVRSYGWLPEGGRVDVMGIMEEVLSVLERMFVIAIKLSAPVLTIMVITNLLLGFIYRATPQMNVFFISSPIYVFIGFLVMLLGVSVFIYLSGAYFNTVRDEMSRVLIPKRG
ncbi:MAG TPA: flagellar biosynthetic protein FliR [Thermodesulfobacteriota bacterium]|jgi:flagellar biosynthetic protein FliR|nr:flagellar biosynthetic protein FliR [Thermodesulfobacteriota bacterium]